MCAMSANGKKANYQVVTLIESNGHHAFAVTDGGEKVYLSRKDMVSWSAHRERVFAKGQKIKCVVVPDTPNSRGLDWDLIKPILKERHAKCPQPTGPAIIKNPRAHQPRSFRL
jgi:hypothetical protein